VPDDHISALLLTVGANVTRLRKQRGMTQAQLAEAIDVETSYEQKLEYGTAVPSLPALVRLAAALKVPLAALFRASKPRKARAGRPRATKATRVGAARR
jgi:transcriptional regulator with XRE-family HTH domain